MRIVSLAISNSHSTPRIQQPLISVFHRWTTPDTFDRPIRPDSEAVLHRHPAGAKDRTLLSNRAGVVLLISNSRLLKEGHPYAECRQPKDQ